MNNASLHNTTDFDDHEDHHDDDHHDDDDHGHEHTHLAYIHDVSLKIVSLNFYQSS